MKSKALIVMGVVIFLLIVLFPFWYMRGKAAPAPEVELTPKAKAALECVRSTEYMQAEHMHLLSEIKHDHDAVIVAQPAQSAETSIETTVNVRVMVCFMTCLIKVSEHVRN